MKTFTRSDVLSWQPCHGKAATLRIMRGLPRKMNAVDVLRHEAATPADRMWCVLRPEALDDRTLRVFAAWCARTTLDAERAAGRDPDPRSWAAVDVAERYALGQATEDELRVARDAADAVGGARADYGAAYGAARAAYYAVRAAYYAARAADYAAYYAGCGAYYAAARAARAAYAYEAQVERLIQMIEEDEK